MPRERGFKAPLEERWSGGNGSRMGAVAKNLFKNHGNMMGIYRLYDVFCWFSHVFTGKSSPESLDVAIKPQVSRARWPGAFRFQSFQSIDLSVDDEFGDSTALKKRDSDNPRTGALLMDQPGLNGLTEGFLQNAKIWKQNPLKRWTLQ